MTLLTLELFLVGDHAALRCKGRLPCFFVSSSLLLLLKECSSLSCGCHLRGSLLTQLLSGFRGLSIALLLRSGSSSGLRITLLLQQMLQFCHGELVGFTHSRRSGLSKGLRLRVKGCSKLLLLHGGHRQLLLLRLTLWRLSEAWRG